MINKKYIWLLALVVLNLPLLADDYYKEYRESWLRKAEQAKPKLVETKKTPQRLVNVEKDADSYQGWKVTDKAAVETLYTSSFSAQPEVIIDFGEHMTGYFTFSLAPFRRVPDSPARLKFTFAEVPSELATPFDPYTGGLGRAWLQDEIITVMHIPETIKIPRRLAFRYVKIELVGKTGNYEFSIADVNCMSVTSAVETPGMLPSSTSDIMKKIDKVSLNTLKECMQTVYEDGPKRDQRLWIGDLYLESMVNNYSFKQYDLTKRCLYLLAGLSGENGYLHATVFEHPKPQPQEKQFLLEYALLYNVTLKDYLEATNDRETALDLWPVAKKQLDIARTYMQNNGLMNFERANSEWWIFFDWKEGLYKETALQGLTIFALKETYALAKMLGKESELEDVPPMIKKMTAAARKHLHDKKTGLYVGLGNKQVSYASQIWMILSGVATKSEAQKALRALHTTNDVCFPGTPYLYHYYIQSLVDAGMKKEAKEALVEYWGGMLDRGADTFWEAYDPRNDFISPYGFFPINSYCHAWSCTPSYFIRKYPDIFQ